MNCQLCQNESDAYREGRLSPDIKNQVEAHLKECKKCAESYKHQEFADRIINHEKELHSDPFLATRIMKRIEDLDNPDYITIPVIRRVLKPVLITAALAAAILYGIIIGSIYKPARSHESIPLELALIDDAAIESVNILSNE
jgi:anti-sigma factor RsiW